MRVHVTVGMAMIAGWVASAALAEQAPSFPELVRQAEKSAPRLMELEADVGAAQGRAKQAAAWPNPTLSTEVEDIAGTGAYRGTAQAQTTVSISEPLELGGQRGARVAAGRAELTAAQARSRQLRADFGYELALAYAAAEAAQTRMDLLAEDLSRAREDLRSARALVQAGKEGQLRAVQAEAAASAAEAEFETSRADSIEALTRLSSLVGVADPFTRVGPSLLTSSPRSPTAPPEPRQTAGAPMIVTAQAERESAELRLAVERKRAIPVPSLSVGTRRIAGDDVNVWVAGFSVPVPIFDRNRGGVAAARAELTAAEARLDSARLDAAAQARAASAQAVAANSRLLASDQGEASAREAYRLAHIGYDAGRTPLIELLSTRRALTESQLRLLDARVARVRAEASLARLAGRIPFTE